MITVYTSSLCAGCRLTKMKLDKEEIVYDTVDLSHDEDALRAVKYLGHLKAPVVCARFPDGADRVWSGFRPDLIDEYINATKGAA